MQTRRSNSYYIIIMFLSIYQPTTALFPQGRKYRLSLYQVQMYLYFRSLFLVIQIMSVGMRQNLALTLHAVYESLPGHQRKIQNQVHGAGISSQVSKLPVCILLPCWSCCSSTKEQFWMLQTHCHFVSLICPSM